jgi:hypothetical protein
MGAWSTSETEPFQVIDNFCLRLLIVGIFSAAGGVLRLHSTSSSRILLHNQQPPDHAIFVLTRRIGALLYAEYLHFNTINFLSAHHSQGNLQMRSRILICWLWLFFVLASHLQAVSAARYVDNGDGTVTDTKTGLMWQQSDDSVKTIWDDPLFPFPAASHCEHMILGDHDDWRLPRIDELLTIIDHTQAMPAISPILNCHNDAYWSNTIEKDHSRVWVVGFTYGGAGIFDKNDKAFVRCVREGPFWSLDTGGRFELDTISTIKDTLWGYFWSNTLGYSGSWDMAKGALPNCYGNGGFCFLAMAALR